MSNPKSNRPSQKHTELLENLPVRVKDLPAKCNSKIIKGFYGQNNEGGYNSNFYRCNISIATAMFNMQKLIDEFGDNILFINSEQLFMFLKGLTFFHRNPENNLKIMVDIVKSKVPSQAKSLGRKLDCSSPDGKPFDDVLWKKERCKCMYDACWFKFTQNPKLAQMLKDTKPLHLVEATSRDKVWGCGINTLDPLLYSPKEWTGLNLLGEVLMIIRDEL